MPPRYVYWTILIDQQPTAFRAKAQEDLLPTLNQLRRTNRDVVLKWFARGRLWESPEAERAAQHKPAFTERRGPDWRPGGTHQDPRARFQKRNQTDRRAPGPRVPKAGGVAPGEKPAIVAPVSRPPLLRPVSKRPAGAPFSKPPAAGQGFRPARKPFGDRPRRPSTGGPWARRKGPPPPRRDRRK